MLNNTIKNEDKMKSKHKWSGIVGQVKLTKHAYNGMEVAIS